VRGVLAGAEVLWLLALLSGWGAGLGLYVVC
jgi:hypothetical protein